MRELVCACMCACGCRHACGRAYARARARVRARMCMCVRERVRARVGAHVCGLDMVGSRTCGRACAYPSKQNGCGKLQIVVLSGKKLENSSMLDFAQHISA